MAREARVCIVHGGGAQISAVARARGIESRFVGGRRVTDRQTLACVREGLAAVSDELCAALAGRRPRLRSRSPTVSSRRGARPSWVSWVSPSACATGAIVAALGEGLVPVVAPLGTRRDGRRSSTSTPTTPRPRSQRRSRPTSSSSSPTCPACSTSAAPCSRRSPPRARRRARAAACCPSWRPARRRCSAASRACTIGIAGTVVTP